LARAIVERQYKDAKVDPDEIDTGALILTGVACGGAIRGASANCLPDKPGEWGRSIPDRLYRWP
jgi:ethanolamine utilization protein EutA (predicted chaperonin)